MEYLTDNRHVLWVFYNKYLIAFNIILFFKSPCPLKKFGAKEKSVFN